MADVIKSINGVALASSDDIESSATNAIQATVSYPEFFTDETHYLKADGTIANVAARSFRMTPYIPVRKNQVIKYRLCGGTSSNALLGFYDVEKTLIETIPGQGNNVWVEDTYTVQEDGFMLASHRYAYSTSAVTYLIIDGVESLVNLIDALDHKSDDVAYMTATWVSYENAFIQGNYYIQASTGRIVENPNYRCTIPLWLHAGDVIHYRIVSGSGSGMIALYDRNMNWLSTPIVGAANGIVLEDELKLEQDCYVRLCDRWYSSLSQERWLYVNDSNNRDTIITLNEEAIESLNLVNRNAHGGNSAILTMLHISDIHASTKNMNRIMEFATNEQSLLDDIILTGDIVANTYDDGMAWFDAVEGTENILLAIGNHDVAVQGNYNTSNYTEEETYSRYFAPYIDNWNLTSYANNQTYYYKDYADSKVRLIVLNCMLDNDATALEAQNTWLAQTLESARQAGYTVLIAEHYPPANANADDAKVTCNFTDLDKVPNARGMSTTIQDTVQTFINSGGDFAGYICGHVHTDYVLRSPARENDELKYPNQYFFCVDCSINQDNYSDHPRTNLTKYFDSFNIVAVDHDKHLIKLIRVGADRDRNMRYRRTLVFDYVNGEIISQN